MFFYGLLEFKIISVVDFKSNNLLKNILIFIKILVTHREYINFITVHYVGDVSRTTMPHFFFVVGYLRSYCPISVSSELLF